MPYPPPPRGPPVVSSSSLFEEYHRCQNWISEREQFSFFSTLKRPLPICFRIRGGGGGSQHELTQDFRRILSRESSSSAVKQLPNNAWQISSFNMISPQMKQWLSTQTKSGNVSRQEYVSMIPVLLLNIQSHDVVLDLCASPGSKTIQALDALYDNHRASANNNNNTSRTPTGFVIANELDPKRSYVLSHRCQTTVGERMASLAVVCHNACKFPNLLAPLQRQQQQQQQQQQEQVSSKSSCPFDKIICDVPCSGDGTLRKDFKVWKTWHPSYGIQLHTTQIRIAKRGLALLKIGGTMTYSTCSFHPIENEAVVAALLATGCIEIVPCDNLKTLRGIRRRPGITDWKVLDDDLSTILLPTSTSSTSTTTTKESRLYPRTLWPPSSSGSTDSTTTCQRTRRQLQRCIRMVPQDNDSGGFFIALLRKIKEFPPPPANKKKGGTQQPPTPPPPPRRRHKIVTPQQLHHQLFPVKQQDDDDDDDEVDDSASTNTKGIQTFTRGPRTTTTATTTTTTTTTTGTKSSHHYRLSDSLADFLTKTPGASKINLVTVGQKITFTRGKKKR